MYAFQAESTTSVSSPLSFAGHCGYEIQNDRIVISIDEIANNRDQANISGTLAIEVWALDRPYSGGEFSGTAVCGTSIGEILGQHFLADCRYDLIFREPQPGTWFLVLMLREWTAAGYVTRDYVNFALPYVVASKPTITRGEADNVINVEFADNKRSLRSAEIEGFLAQEDQPQGDSVSTRLTPERDRAVSLNTASYKEIAAVKGISKKLAENIVAGRPFEALDHVLRVKGMGAKLLKKVRHLIKL